MSPSDLAQRLAQLRELEERNTRLAESLNRANIERRAECIRANRAEGALRLLRCNSSLTAHQLEIINDVLDPEESR